jgi:hypothetical protein
LVSQPLAEPAGAASPSPASSAIRPGAKLDLSDERSMNVIRALDDL